MIELLLLKGFPDKGLLVKGTRGEGGFKLDFPKSWFTFFIVQLNDGKK